MTCTRRECLGYIALAPVLPAVSLRALGNTRRGTDQRPNILFAIADDWSWPHAGIAGDPVVKTPTFDRVARAGVVFRSAFCPAPSCTASRGGILTGQPIYRLEEGGNLWGTLPAKFPVYPDLLAKAGYHVGYTRKGWGPGSCKAGSRTTNPAGSAKYASLDEFLDADQTGRPFCFWFGSHDPHRGYKLGSGKASGMDPARVEVPACLPDADEIRSDICDYYFEVQRFDREVGQMLDLLRDRGLLENTVVVVTSDNGMPFPRAKATLYDLGTHMPLAITWPRRVPGGRTVDDFVSLTDLAPTFLEAAGIKPPAQMTGRSLLPILTSDKEGRVDSRRDAVVTARERHAWVRAGGLSYPSRALRTHKFLYIRNYEPDRWPAGDPPLYGDIDNRDLRAYTPTKDYMMAHRDDPAVAPLFHLAFGKRPGEELYDLRRDPGQSQNVAADPDYSQVRKRLDDRLHEYLKATGDPRASGCQPLWDSYPYYGNKETAPRQDAPIGNEQP